MSDTSLSFTNHYGVCVAESRYESLLPELAALIEASYQPGEFTQATCDADYEASEEGQVAWELKGRKGRLVIHMEAAESYLFSDLWSAPSVAQASRRLLWEAYIASGGNPARVVAP